MKNSFIKVLSFFSVILVGCSSTSSSSIPLSPLQIKFSLIKDMNFRLTITGFGILNGVFDFQGNRVAYESEFSSGTQVLGSGMTSEEAEYQLTFLIPMNLDASETWFVEENDEMFRLSNSYLADFITNLDILDNTSSVWLQIEPSVLILTLDMVEEQQTVLYTYSHFGAIELE
jgi:hypothetical protein